MKRIGLLGGMSWQSSIEYERIINERVAERLGGVHSADLVIRSYDFARIEALQAAGDWVGAGEVLAADARLLQHAGAEFIVVCTNTMHVVAPAIAAAIDVPLLHIGDATADAVHRAGIRTVALLGTRYTMEGEFYRGRLEQAGLQVLIPDDAQRTIVHDVIYGELVRGIVTDESRAAYLAIIADLASRGARGVIAGCTEIELLVTPADIGSALGLAYFPTARLHAEAAADFALSDR